MPVTSGHASCFAVTMVTNYLENRQWGNVRDLGQNQGNVREKSCQGKMPKKFS